MLGLGTLAFSRKKKPHCFQLLLLPGKYTGYRGSYPVYLSPPGQKYAFPMPFALLNWISYISRNRQTSDKGKELTHDGWKVDYHSLPSQEMWARSLFQAVQADFVSCLDVWLAHGGNVQQNLWTVDSDPTTIYGFGKLEAASQFNTLESNLDLAPFCNPDMINGLVNLQFDNRQIIVLSETALIVYKIVQEIFYELSIHHQQAAIKNTTDHNVTEFNL